MAESNRADLWHWTAVVSYKKDNGWDLIIQIETVGTQSSILYPLIYTWLKGHLNRQPSCYFLVTEKKQINKFPSHTKKLNVPFFEFSTN